MDPAGSGGRVGDDPRDARFEAFLEVASPPDLPPDMAAQIRAGLARQYDAPPVEQTALVLRSNCTVDRLRQMIYWPTEEDAELYPALIRSPPPGAPSTHPSARTQVTFLMATYLRHAKDRRFAEAFVLAGGLASLVPLLVHPNLHLRGQAMETFVQFTDEALFPWHEPPRAQSSTDKAMHQRMLELAKQALVPNLTANVVSPLARKEGDGENVENDAPTFPGGSGLALRAFAFFASYLRLRHCPGNVLRLSDELLSVLRSVADDENASESDKRSDDERALAFVECDRHAPQLEQLRTQKKDVTGLFAEDVTGDFEVRFKGESAVGSAVAREWMDLLARRAFIKGGGALLRTCDGGRSFLPNAAALYGNPHWEGDFEALGRLFGLAVWQQVTLDLPLHSYVCAWLLNDGEAPSEGDRLRA